MLKFARQTAWPAAAACILAALLLMAGCAGPSQLARPETGTSGAQKKLPLAAFRQIGMASFYAEGLHDYQTASGELYNADGFTAGHPVLPFNTLVKVTNLSNNLSVTVRINDRGPYTKRRIIDLSRAAARKIGLLESGTAKVELQVIKQQD